MITGSSAFAYLFIPDSDKVKRGQKRQTDGGYVRIPRKIMFSYFLPQITQKVKQTCERDNADVNVKKGKSHKF